VSNAIDSMNGLGGRLMLRSREGVEWKIGRRGLVLTVADTDAGSRRKRWSASSIRSSARRDWLNGPGVRVSQEIVERHRGRLRVRSGKRDGLSGTVFVLFLPFESGDSVAALRWDSAEGCGIRDRLTRGTQATTVPYAWSARRGFAD
jgi:signal transduction histidine kinase